MTTALVLVGIACLAVNVAIGTAAGFGRSERRRTFAEEMDATRRALGTGTTRTRADGLRLVLAMAGAVFLALAAALALFG